MGGAFLDGAPCLAAEAMRHAAGAQNRDGLPCLQRGGPSGTGFSNQVATFKVRDLESSGLDRIALGPGSNNIDTTKPA